MAVVALTFAPEMSKVAFLMKITVCSSKRGHVKKKHVLIGHQTWHVKHGRQTFEV